MFGFLKKLFAKSSKPEKLVFKNREELANYILTMPKTTIDADFVNQVRSTFDGKRTGLVSLLDDVILSLDPNMRLEVCEELSRLIGTNVSNFATAYVVAVLNDAQLVAAQKLLEQRIGLVKH